MSEQHRFARRPRWISAALSAVVISGSVLVGLASPASAAALPSHLAFEQWADVGSTWLSGSLGNGGVGASTYAEGDTVPFRLEVTSAGAGTFDMTVCRDYQNGSTFGYLSLEPYNTSRSPLVAGTAVSNGAFTGVALVGGVAIDSVTEIGGQGSCKAGQRQTDVRVAISNGPGGVAPVGAYVLWGGHLASPADAGVGVGHGAGYYSGASLAMDNSAAAKNLGIKVLKSAAITVQKQVDSGSASADQFCFTINPNPNNVAAQCPAAGQDTVAFLGLSSGNYSISEVGVSGYTFASGGGTANCLFANGAATVNVAAGDTPTNATCIFHNRREIGTLTVNQVINPSDDPGRFDLEIDGAAAGTGANVGNGGTTGPIVVDSGAHGVGNAALPGTDSGDYTSSVSCVAGTTPVAYSNGQVTVADGQNVVCTITLAPVTPRIIEDPTLPTVPTTQPTVPTTQPTTTTTTVPDRCASNRGTKPQCSGQDPVEEVIPEIPTAPVVDPITTVAGGGEQGSPVQDEVLSGQIERAAPAPSADPMPAATLPRTGAGIGDQVTVAAGLLFAGLALLRVSRRRRPSTSAS